MQKISFPKDPMKYFPSSWLRGLEGEDLTRPIFFQPTTDPAIACMYLPQLCKFILTLHPPTQQQQLQQNAWPLALDSSWLLPSLFQRWKFLHLNNSIITALQVGTPTHLPLSLSHQSIFISRANFYPLLAWDTSRRLSFWKVVLNLKF